MNLLFLVLILCPLVVAASVSCPYGIVNDSPPGRCPRYTDADSDNICDLSQPSIEQSDKPLEPLKTVTSTTISPNPSQNPPIVAPRNDSPALGGGYDFLNLTSFMLLAYGISFFANRTGRLSLRGHRMVWNTLLLFSFIVCTVLGIVLVLRLNYGIVLPIPLNMLYWHVESGIAMSVISVFHILWHGDYYRSMLRKTPKPIGNDNSGKIEKIRRPKGRRGR